MKGSGFFGVFRGAWWILYWSVGVVFAVFVVAVVIDLAHMPQRTADAVTAIHAQRLTMADVDGKHLPPAPDPKLADATVEGIDANKNGIRDDVELAIFKKYPNDIKIRAAELQYAMELQNELVNVFNSGTLVAVIQEEGRGYGCIFDTTPKVTLDDPQSKWTAQQRVVDSRKNEVETLIFNTAERKSKHEKIFQKYMTSYSELNGDDCDLKSF